MGEEKRWGTWEELILGSAVLRHGNREWEVIASELRVRTVYPFSFTPQACKAKYEDLQQHYSGCTAWFEELKKRRVEELKLELEKSEGSIGSLESKLKMLKTENENYCQVDYDTSRTESPALVPKTEVNESSGKETSKDSLSAGSFTHDFKSNWSPECRIPALAAPEMETKPKVLESDEQEKLVSIKVAELRYEKGSTVRKRRGKRKRKDCNWEVREGSIGESDNFGSINVLISSYKETSTSGHNEEHFKGPSDDLMGIFNFIAESKHAFGFRRRLDSQKRARYKKIIRQHKDLDTIRSRIGSGSIKSTKELFRDLLLLANNAMVFYSKRTREYKSALSLRDFVTKEYHQHCKDSVVPFSPICNLPVKPRSFCPHPGKSKFSAKPNDAASGIAGTLLGNKRVGDAASSTPSHSRQSSGMVKKSSGAPQGYLKPQNADSSICPLGSLVMAKKRAGTPHGCKKLNNADSNLLKQSMVMAKKGLGHPGKVGQGMANHRSKTPVLTERKKQDKRKRAVRSSSCSSLFACDFCWTRVRQPVHAHIRFSLSSVVSRVRIKCGASVTSAFFGLLPVSRSVGASLQQQYQPIFMCFPFLEGICGVKMKPFMGIVCTVMLFVVYRTTNYQYQQTELDSELHPLYALQQVGEASTSLNAVPHGIIHTRSDLDLKPLWLTSSSKSKATVSGPCYLLAIPVGIKQMGNVNTIVQKFLSENFTIVLLHYDGKVDGWWNLEWSNEAIHIVAQNQTKWWFAKRFLHPSVVSIYDYIFLWDEDLGVEHFNPRRYLKIVKAAGLEISQPALDPNSTGIHHRITIRSRTKKFHRRVYDTRGSTKCTRDSEGPPCTGFVEGMAPVFSRSAWHCAWHLIQNDLVHGWGMDMKLGYCAQGDRTKNVGVVDSEYVVHQGIQTLGGPSAKKGSKSEDMLKRHSVDERVETRRQSTAELQIFKQRWEQAVKEDGNWVEPVKRRRRCRPPQRHHGMHF